MAGSVSHFEPIKIFPPAINLCLYRVRQDVTSSLSGLAVSLVGPQIPVGKPLRMVIGYQRSGTNALFSCLSTDAVVAYNEDFWNAVYRRWLLRGERSLRALFCKTSKPILLKPTSESYVRSIDDVVDEFAGYDMRAVFIHRDPVNVYYSNVQHSPGAYDDVGAFIDLWRLRTQRSLCKPAHLLSHVVYVRYEDLVTDASLVDRLAEYLGIPARHGFSSDSGLGYRRLPADTIDLIKRDTSALVEAIGDLVAASYAHLDTLDQGRGDRSAPSDG